MQVATLSTKRQPRRFKDGDHPANFCKQCIYPEVQVDDEQADVVRKFWRDGFAFIMLSRKSLIGDPLADCRRPSPTPLGVPVGQRSVAPFFKVFLSEGTLSRSCPGHEAFFFFMVPSLYGDRYTRPRPQSGFFVIGFYSA
jgi:hypothetical protein